MLQHRILLPMLLLCLASPSDASQRACSPSVSVQQLLDQGEGKSSVSLPYAKWILESVRLAEEAARKFPDDLYAQKQFQDKIRGQGEEDEYQALVQQYKNRLDANPVDATNLFLYGNILRDRKQSALYFVKALEEDPEFPLVYKSLAAYYWNDDPNLLKDTIDKWIALCPEATEPYSYLLKIADNAYKSARAADFRSLVASLPFQSAASAYLDLWSLEFSLVPVDKLPTLHEQIRTDLNRFSHVENLTWNQLEILKEGYRLLDDQRAVREIEEDQIRLFPDSEDAAQIVMDRWIKEHPESQRTTEEYLKVTEEWVKRWPRNRFASWRRLAAMYLVDGIPAEQIQAAAERVLEHNRELPSTSMPPEEFTVAQILLDNHLSLDRISSIIDQGSSAIQKKLMRSEYVYTADQFTEVKQYLELRETSLRAQLAILSDMQPEADRLLAKINEVINKVSLPENVKAYKATYWALRALQAEKSKKNADALGYYHAALQQNPSDRRITKCARDLWTELGGTDEGWSQFEISFTKTVAIVRDTNRVIPEFELKDLKGRTWRKKDFERKVTFLNVWATWCGPCLWELPAIEEIYQKIQDKDGLQIVTLNIDENPGLITPFMKQHGYSFPVVPALSIFDSLNPEGVIPQNWVVNDRGSITKKITGFNEDRKLEWIDQIISTMLQLQEDSKDQEVQEAQKDQKP
jgi:thiol-disulfide isomerase/thioredoxin